MEAYMIREKNFVTHMKRTENIRLQKLTRHYKLRYGMQRHGYEVRTRFSLIRGGQKNKFSL